MEAVHREEKEEVLGEAILQVWEVNEPTLEITVLLEMESLENTAVVMVAMGEPQAVEEEVLEDKVTGEVQEEVQAVMEEEGKLGFFLGKYL